MQKYVNLYINEHIHIRDIFVHQKLEGNPIQLNVDKIS